MSGLFEADPVAGNAGDEPGKFLKGLNDAQRRAVEHEGGPLIVLAGPGTGKTRVITRRIAHLISDRGVNPDGILALTFTNHAGEALRGRGSFH